MTAAPDLRFQSIDGLRAFEAAERLGSFERAAAELHISASAVSKRLATLEDLLATPLLLRQPKALVLTSAGQDYLQQVRAALGLLAAMPLHQRPSQRLQRLRVTAPPTFARQVLVPQLQHFTSAHPHIELELLLSIPFLASGDTESAPKAAALRRPPPQGGGETLGAARRLFLTSDIEVRAADPLHTAGTLLLADRVLPLIAPALLARLPPLRCPADLAHAPLLRTPLQPWAPWLRAAGLDWPEPASGPKLVDLGLTLEAAVAGQGVALARPTLAWHWLDTGTLQPLFNISAPCANPYLLLPHDSYGAAAEFAAWLQAICQAHSARASAWLSALA